MNQGQARVLWSLALVVAIALAGLMLAGCGQQSPSAPESSDPAPAADPSQTTPDGSSDEVSDPAPTVISMPSAGITLTWWTPEFYSPEAGGGSGEVLLEQIAGFVDAYPDISLHPILKAAHGKGGILDFLRTARAGAPSVMPDVVTIDSTDLPAAVQNKLLQPLDDLLAPELRNDLFPFARSVGQFDGRWYAVQFEADVQHLVYRMDKVQRPPATWQELLSGRAVYIFPAGGRQELVNNASLIQYLGAGGSIDQATRALSLVEQPLREMLTFYRQGLETRLISAEVLNFDTVEDCWPAYLAEEADMSNVLSTRYLVERAALEGSGFASLPTLDGNAVTVSQGWTLAVVATDGAHRAAAVQFVEWMLSPEHNAAWTQAAGRLPTREAALDVWGNEDEYRAFLRSQLAGAVSRPTGTASVQTARLLQQAVRGVLTGAATPEDAVEQALQAAGS